MINVRCLDRADVGTLRIEKFDGQSWEAKPMRHTPGSGKTDIDVNGRPPARRLLVTCL